MLLFAPALAQAAPGNTRSVSGTATAAIIRPIAIVAVASLRFGVIARPSTAGTLTVSTTGAVSTTGGVTGSNAINQGALAARTGTFRVTGDPGRSFVVVLPPTATVTTSAGSMNISLFTVGALPGSTSGTLDIAVGGTLSVSAAQTPGAYSGTYRITATYQ
ncbi:DUF4402 domain-containing protein [Novosphingobium sp. Chol11]|uniref:DUF4402 domain-containing protein n=1 Tax=Novosphingobium sp. Chol11 TaxID=1385763 RepID=UPI0025D5F008|nr:DUF4402 domain-containing protein [Novosphingobium sp. Chol11]